MFLYVFLFLGAGQYYLYTFITSLKKYSLTVFFVFTAIAVIFALTAFFKRPNVLQALSVLPAIIGTAVFVEAPMDLVYFVFFGIAVILLMAGYVYELKEGKHGELCIKDRELYFAAAGWAVFSVLIVFLVDKFYWNHDDCVHWYFPLRCRGGNLDGIMGMPFKKFHLLIPVFLYLASVLLFLYFVVKKRVNNVWLHIIFLVAAAFVGKIIISSLSTQGLLVVEAKTKTAFNNGYWFWAMRIEDVYEFISNYVGLYQNIFDTGHLRGHPIMSVLFYWIIIEYISKDPQMSGYIYGLTASLAVIPFYFLVRYMTGLKTAGFVAALFYALTPNSMILSISGTDALVVLFVAFFVWLAVTGAGRDRQVILVLSGIFFGIGTYFSFGIWHLLMFVFLMIFRWEVLREKRKIPLELIKWTRNVIAVLLGVVAAHLFFWMFFNGAYNYIDSFNMAKIKSVPHMLNRPYQMWSWLNFIHWSHFISIPVMALFFMRFIKWSNINPAADRFSLAAFAVVAMQFLAALGRAETQRMYMYLIVFVIPAAVLAVLCEKSGEKIELKFSRAAIISALVFINSVLIEIFITDTV